MKCEDYDYKLTDKNSYDHIDKNNMGIKQILCYIKRNKSIKFNHNMKTGMVFNLMILDDMGILASHYDDDGLRVYYANEPFFSQIIKNLETMTERLIENQKNANSKTL